MKNVKLLKKWIKALRSGSYKRATGRLVNHQGTAFCCLGVLADIQGCVWKEGITPGHTMDLYPIMPHGRKLFSTNAAILKDATEGGYLQPKRAGGLAMNEQKTLANMNDNGDSFKKIAAYLENKFIKKAK